MNSKIIREIESESQDQSEYDSRNRNYALSDDYHSIYEKIEIEIEYEIIAYLFNNYDDFEIKYQKVEKGDIISLNIIDANNFIKFIQINFSEDLEKEIEKDIDLADNLIEIQFNS